MLQRQPFTEQYLRNRFREFQIVGVPEVAQTSLPQGTDLCAQIQPAAGIVFALHFLVMDELNS